jgi:hypothetical protein
MISIYQQSNNLSIKWYTHNIHNGIITTRNIAYYLYYGLPKIFSSTVVTFEERRNITQAPAPKHPSKSTNHSLYFSFFSDVTG